MIQKKLMTAVLFLAKNDLLDDDGEIEEICDDGDNQIENESLEEACLTFNDHFEQVRAAFDMDFAAMLITQILVVPHTSIDAFHFEV